MLSCNINCKNFSVFLKAIENKKDPVANYLKNEFMYLKGEIHQLEGDYSFLQGFEGLADHTNRLKQKLTELKKVSDKHDGIDVDLIRDVVSDIFNFSAGIIPVEDERRDALRSEYFSLMRDSGLLQTEIESCDGITYDVGEVVQDFLTNHPDTTTLILGCGMRVTYHGSCCSGEKKLHEKALTVDMNASMGATVQSNMHNSELWRNIPDNSFSEILDHSNGNWVFENTATLKEIFRVLRSGGEFRTLSPSLNEEEGELLKAVGFSIIEGKAFKPE